MRSPAQWEVHEVAVAIQGQGGHKQRHLVIVTQRVEVSQDSSHVLVVPVTHQFEGKGNVRRVTVPIDKGRNHFLSQDSFALVSYLHRADKSRLQKPVGTLHPLDQGAIRLRLQWLFAL